MEAYIFDWISLFFRWFHVIAGIAWIGASFYFVWLDNSLQTPPQWKQDKGIKGDLWAIHGGGFYEVAKYRLGPEQMPETLHWFKWESYITWLTGMALLIIVYYSQAHSFMLGSHTWIDNPQLSVVAGMVFLAVAVSVYEIIFRSPALNNMAMFTVLMIMLLVLLSWFAFHLFSPRAAFIQVGAAIGSIMVGNVFFGIIPAQTAFVAAVKNGQQPDAVVSQKAGLRSRVNNYFTLPVIFIMISNHYPFVYSNELGWVWLILISVLTAYARHYFNLKHQGVFRPGILVTAIIGLVVLAIAMMPDTLRNPQAAIKPVNDAMAMSLIHHRCTVCHSQNPVQPGFNAPPAGLKLETMEQMINARDRVLQAVVYTHYMPLGNVTQMTLDERKTLASWLQSKIDQKK